MLRRQFECELIGLRCERMRDRREVFIHEDGGSSWNESVVSEVCQGSRECWLGHILGQSLVSSSSTDRSNTSSRDRIVTTVYPESVPAHTPPQAQHPKRSLHRCYIRFHVLHISIYPLVRAHVIILQSERPTTVSSPLLHLPPCSRSHSMIFLPHLHLPTFVS
jgi:hypothetical protein